MKANLDAAATALGMTTEELRTELRAGTSLATIAGEQGVEVGKVVSALVADAKARLAQAVTDGKLTQAQADERSANLEARITDLVNRTPPAGFPMKGGHRGGPGVKADLNVAATAIGISVEDLRAGLEAGKSIATIAGEHGVDAQKVIDALVADAKAHLAEAVANGKITQAQADERSADLDARITNLVNSAPPVGGMRHGPHGPRPEGASIDGTQPATLTA